MGIMTEAVIVVANARAGRYAARTRDGEFIAFEILDGTELRAGEIIRGDIDAPGGETFRTERGQPFSVFMEITGGTRIAATAWASR